MYSAEEEVHDVTTTEEMVLAMERKYGKANRIWVMDRGMVSEENIEFIKERGARYIVGTPKSMLRKFEQQLLAKGWEEVRPDVEVKICACPESGEETFVLCRSERRRDKETAILNRFLTRLEVGLERLKEQAEKGRLREIANRRSEGSVGFWRETAAQPRFLPRPLLRPAQANRSILP